MSFRDRMSTQNAVQLLSIGTTLGLITAASTNGKKYNFPLMVSSVPAFFHPPLVAEERGLMLMSSSSD